MRTILQPFGTLTKIEYYAKGFMFCQFETVQQANIAVKKVNNTPLDKSHTLLVNKILDIDMNPKLPIINTEFVEPPNLHGWLLDTRDQYAVTKDNTTEVYWFKKQLAFSRQKMSDSFTLWSPKGSYLAAFLKPGLVLSGSDTFDRLLKFPHPNVQLAQFSPSETYLITWSFDPVNEEGHNLFVWDVITATLLRSLNYEIPSANKVEAGSTKIKINYHFSPTEKYLARGTNNAIFVYELPTMELLDKKSIKIDKLQSFSWSPIDNTILYCTPEYENIPARIALMSIPSRHIIRSKNFFNVTNISHHWHPSGTFLLAKIDRQKTKKQLASNFEVFRLKEKDIPVDILECPNNITSIEWDPKGTKFAVLVPKQIFIYDMIKSTGISLKHLLTATTNTINELSWSPNGRFLVLSGIREGEGKLEFWDTETLTLLATSDHFQLTQVEWDQCGRYFATVVTYPYATNDTGFKVYSPAGAMLHQEISPRFKQFSWRPRPNNLLSEEKISEIDANLKKYSKTFDDIDYRETNQASKEIVDMRNKLWVEWVEFRKACIDRHIKNKDARISLWGFDTDEFIMNNIYCE